MKRIVIGLDPAITVKENRTDRHCGGGALPRWPGLWLADSSGRLSPNGWAAKAIGQFKSLNADCIVAEGNQGGEMVRHTIQSVMPNAPVRIVHASRGKQARAELIGCALRTRPVTHAAAFSELKTRCAWGTSGRHAIARSARRFSVGAN